MATSFVENINAVANASALATGDIVSDTQSARDEAIRAAQEAFISKTHSADSEEMSRKWSENGHNQPVKGTIGVDAEMSSYHWSVVSSLNVGDPLINDAIISAAYTWSSEKVSAKLANKSALDHLHAGVYEPMFSKNTAFNRNFTVASGEAGSSENVSREDHLHTSSYEPKRVTQGSAYNRDFGSTSGTVMQGDKRFDDDYMQKVVEKSAYNKNFTIDTNNPQSEEVPRATHNHPATKIAYDNAYNTGNNVITSTTVQGGMEQLDNAFAQVTVAEKSKVTAGMTNDSFTLTIDAVDVPKKITTSMTQGTSKNANYSGGDVVINYDVDPDKLVEGWYAASVTIAVPSGSEAYAMAILVNDVEVDSSFRAKFGSEDVATTGVISATLSGFMSGLSNADKIGIGIINFKNTDNVDIRSHTVSWAGEPEGALVASGISVNHGDILDRDVAQQHPMSSIYETGNINTNLDTVMFRKADKVTSPILDNILAMDADGNIKDSGLSISDTANHMNKVPSATLDNIVIMDSQGESKDGGKTIADLALVTGAGTQTFSVASSTADSHAVNQGQMNALSSTYTTQVTFDTHEAAINPHNTTASAVGAAELVHTHVIADTTDLQTTLDDKYAKLAAPATDNLVSFGAGQVLLDSGMSAISTLLIGE